MPEGLSHNCRFLFPVPVANFENLHPKNKNREQIDRQFFVPLWQKVE